jgi:UDP-perosamine 4-acetyltransferase
MRIVVIGAGGHGKVVIDLLRTPPLKRRYMIEGIIDADESLVGQRVGGAVVLGGAHLLGKLQRKGVAGAVVAIGDNRARLQYLDEVRAARMRCVTVVHPRAIVCPTAVLGEGVCVAAGAVICAEAQVEDAAIINSGAVVDHECRIGRGAHVCPSAALAGRVSVGEGAFVGLGARVIQCLSVGAWAIVGAGAVVVGDVPAETTVVGVPARPLPPRSKTLRV